MHQANREAVFAWLDACSRKPKAELLQIFKIAPVFVQSETFTIDKLNAKISIKSVI